jgi:hypothetical protein
MTDAVIHEPCGFLSHPDCAVDFVGTHTVFAIDNLPHSSQPLVQTERRVFKDRSSLRSELTVVMARTALPAIVLGKERDILAPASRTGDTFRPAPRYDVFAAVRWIGKVYDGFLEGGEYGFHVAILPESV